MRPTKPIKIDKDFDVIDGWLYGKYHSGTRFRISFTLQDGNPYNWTGGTNAYISPGQLFEGWTLAHIVLSRVIERGAELTSLEIIPPKPGEYLFHIDQFQVLSFKNYLAGTSTPEFKHVGEVVKLPVDPSGACPKTAEAAKSSAYLSKGNGYLKYMTNTGEEVCYAYTPKTGTLSDLTVEVTGKSPFRPADASGPVFDYAGKSFSTPAGNCKAEGLSQKVGGGTLSYTWRYRTPAGTTIIDYRFRLNGKSLMIEAESKEATVSN